MVNAYLVQTVTPQMVSYYQDTNDISEIYSYIHMLFDALLQT